MGFVPAAAARGIAARRKLKADHRERSGDLRTMSSVRSLASLDWLRADLDMPLARATSVWLRLAVSLAVGATGEVADCRAADPFATISWKLLGAHADSLAWWRSRGPYAEQRPVGFSPGRPVGGPAGLGPASRPAVQRPRLSARRAFASMVGPVSGPSNRNNCLGRFQCPMTVPIDRLSESHA